MNQTIKTILAQIDAPKLSVFCNIVFITMDDHTIRVHRRNKNLDISYDEGSDLYNISKHTLNQKTLETTTEKVEGLYYDQLQDAIKFFFDILTF